ncbi:universal stress protein [Streptomyces sp. KMM 9044]|uniref:universal stress protein n=1 Tax=Streptomyces sp. KMM 9044 TaxID=2744474 RepID=UPI00215160D1|nr:universal stress protein [Streptomyces sp. KMM 9044]WAX81283.1 universal stress protein [Streptomyces sp. KMM 9044]
MPRTITIGFDGSAESRAAAEWAAREAKLRGLPLRLFEVREPPPEPVAQAPLAGAEAGRQGRRGGEAEALPADGWGTTPGEAAAGLRLRHPGVEVTTEQVTGRPHEVLTEAAEDAELLVLGSRGMSGFAGFLVGSVGLAVVARTERPVVLVRAGEQAADEHEPDPTGIPSAATRYRPVLLGVDADRPDAAVIRFAFAEAARRGTGLRVLHGWNLPSYYVHGLPADPHAYQVIAEERAAALAKLLRPWRAEFEDVDVVEESFGGSPSTRLIDASREASLVVVGRRVSHNPFGIRTGPITHAVLHHSAAPVAVVAHD